MILKKKKKGYYSLVLTRQSLWMVLQTALYLFNSNNSPSETSCMKSRSLYVGRALALSLAEARRLYVEPFRSNLRCIRTELGSKLFMTTMRMFLPAA